MAPTFMYEYMNSEAIMPSYKFSQPSHPFYTVSRSTNAEYHDTFGEIRRG